MPVWRLFPDRLPLCSGILVQTDHDLRKEITRYRLPLGVGLQNHQHIRHRRPLTESFVLPAYNRGDIQCLTKLNVLPSGRVR